MDKVLISIMIVTSLIIQRFESNISNENLNKKIQNWHLSVKKHLELIINSKYNNVSKKILSKWFSIIFILLAVIEYVSVSIFGNDSDNTLLKNNTWLMVVAILFILLLGFIGDKKDIIITSIITVIAGIVLVYVMFNEEYNPYISQYAMIEKVFTIIIILIAVVIIILFSLIFHYLLKGVAYGFYFYLKKYFCLCIYLNSQKPLKPLVVMTELIFIILIPIFSLF